MFFEEKSIFFKKKGGDFLNMFSTEVREIFNDFYLRNRTVYTFFLVFILNITKNQEKNENDKFVEFPFKF